jgi:hypothetical protein
VPIHAHPVESAMDRRSVRLDDIVSIEEGSDMDPERVR